MYQTPLLTAFLLLFSYVNQAQSTPISSLGIWEDTQRVLPTTSVGHKTALVCHNCYHTDLNTPSAAYSLEKTLQKIDAAIDAEADLIELDIVDADGEIRIKRKDTQSAYGALLSDVLAFEKLRNSDQLLFLEIKEEKRTTEQFMWTLLNELKNYGYAAEGRPVVIRAIPEGSREEFLFEARELLKNYFSPMQAYVKLSVVLPVQMGDVPEEMTKTLQDIHQDQLHFVEFNYKTKNLYQHLKTAKSLGLGTGLWTIPEKDGAIFIAAFRNEVDLLSIDSDLVFARSVIQDNNQLFYLNQAAPDSVVTRRGYLVTAVVKFTDLEIAENTSSHILTRSKNDDFTLELYNPGGTLPTVLRFGVKVNNAYEYAFLKTTQLNTEDMYIIIGAYDGDGTVDLWVNQEKEGITTAHTRGNVPTTPTPVLVGNAMDKNAKMPFEVKMASLQSWGRWDR